MKSRVATADGFSCALFSSGERRKGLSCIDLPNQPKSDIARSIKGKSTFQGIE